MIDSSEVDEILQELFNKIMLGKITLFVGSGMGKNCNPPLPDAYVLAENILSNFPNTKYKDLRFLDLCDKIIFDDLGNRAIINDIIISNLENKRPSKYHNYITWYPWRAIFTTNYDHVLEEAYLGDSSLKELKVIIDPEDDTIGLPDPSKLKLYKLHGDIRYGKNRTRKIILGYDDIARNSIDRKSFYDMMFNKTFDGNFLFVGYSFDDQVVTRNIDYLREEYTDERLPHSYAIIHSQPTQETLENLEKRKIIPIVIDTRLFFDKLIKEVEPHRIKQQYQDENERIQISGGQVDLTPLELSYFETTFTLLTDTKVTEAEGHIDNFYRGQIQNWGAYRNNWDFKRLLYDGPDGIKNYIRNLLDQETKLDEMIQIDGAPGVGKSVILHRLAYDLYTEFNLPVFVAQPYLVQSIAVGKLFDQIKKFRKKVTEIDDTRRVPLIFIFDNSTIYGGLIESLFKYLRSEFFSFIIIYCDRINNLRLKKDDFIEKTDLIQDFNINFSMEEVEVKRFQIYMNRIGKPEFATVSAHEIMKEVEFSFFAVMYTLLVSTQEPLEDSIIRAFNDTRQKYRTAILFIAVIQIFNLRTPKSLLYRLFQMDFIQFQEEVIDAHGDFIQTTSTREGIEFYRIHHKIMAEIILKNQEENITNLLKRIIDVAVPSQPEEIDVLKGILITYLGSRDNWTQNLDRPTLNSRRELFSITSKKVMSSSILHHWALIENQAEEYDKALEILRRAFTIRNSESERVRENESSLFNTLAVTYAKRAKQLFRQNNILEADKSLKDSDLNFDHARKQGGIAYPNASQAYHGKFQISFVIEDLNTKLFLLAEAIHLLIIGVGHSSSTERDIYDDYYGRVMDQISKYYNSDDELIELAREISTDRNSVSGYIVALTAKIGLLTNFEQEITTEDKQYFNTLLDEANSKFRSNTELSIFELWILIIEEKNNYILSNYIYEDLAQWYARKDRTRNVYLEYVLMREAGRRVQFDDANKIAKNLRRITDNRNDNLIVRDYNYDEFDNLTYYYGEIDRFGSYSNIGWLIVKFDEYNSGRIYFRYDDHTFKRGDKVFFQIGYTLWGPIAVNLINVENFDFDSNSLKIQNASMFVDNPNLSIKVASHRKKKRQPTKISHESTMRVETDLKDQNSNEDEPKVTKQKSLDDYLAQD